VQGFLAGQLHPGDYFSRGLNFDIPAIAGPNEPLQDVVEHGEAVA
jgi:hypothetical protein